MHVGPSHQVLHAPRHEISFRRRSHRQLLDAGVEGSDRRQITLPEGRHDFAAESESTLRLASPMESTRRRSDAGTAPRSVLAATLTFAAQCS